MIKPRRDERASMLMWVLIILGIGCLLIPVLLKSVSASLLTTKAAERRLKELYSADAGVEFALYEISHEGCKVGSFKTPGLVNNMPVSITVSMPWAEACKIQSEAGDTIVESYLLRGPDLSWLLDNVVTSPGNVTIKGDVIGEVHCPEEPGGCDDPLCDWHEDDVLDWPSAGVFREYYWHDVEDVPAYPDALIDLAGMWEIGPLYRDGDLIVDNTGGHITVTLSSSIYVAGDLAFAETGVPDAYVLDMNGNAMYAEGEIDLPSGVVDIVGSGCIIAEGDVKLHPRSMADEFVFVMSINGQADILPGGSWSGAVAGDVVVELFPGTSLMWTPPLVGLKFPQGDWFDIVTYDVVGP